MSSETASGVVAWIASNAKKVQSVIASVAVYVGTLQGIAAGENGDTDKWKHFWDLLQEQPGLVVPGVVLAAISGWRTSSHASKSSQRRQERFDAKVAAAQVRNNGGGAVLSEDDAREA